MSQTSALPEISVIIPAFNAERFLPLQLEALDAQSGAPSYEVVVVDNASGDGSTERLRREGLTVVESSENRGFGAGVNLGALGMEEEVLVLLNNDAVAEAGRERARTFTWEACAAAHTEVYHALIGGAV